MSDTLTFRGNKIQVTNQLKNYMHNDEDANKFFALYFDKSSTSLNSNSFRSTSKIYKSAGIQTPKDAAASTVDFQNILLQKTNPQVVVCKRVTQRNKFTVVAPYGACRLRIPNKSAKTQYINTKKRTATPKLPAEEIDNVTIVMRENKRLYTKIIAKSAFVALAVSAEIALNCILNLSIVGTALTAVSMVFKPKEKSEQSTTACIASIVASNKFLPKYKSICNSSCKNLCLNCQWRSEGKCKITKNAFKENVTALFEKGILMLADNEPTKN